MEKQIDESTGLIIASIEAQAARECDKLHSEAERLYAEKAEALKAEIEGKYDSLVKYEQDKQRLVAGQKATALETEYKEALAALRKKVTDEVFAEARKKLCAFTETDGYARFLENSARKLSELYPCDAVLRLRAVDEAYKPLLAQAFGRDVTFEVDTDIAIGGLRAYFAKAGAVADDTLDARFEARQKAFAGTSGLGAKG